MGRRKAPLILILDDNPIHRAGVKETLEWHGYAVKEVGTIDEAQRVLEHDKPAMAIVDIRLDETKKTPDHSGIDFFWTLPEGFPVIVRSDYADLPGFRALQEGRPARAKLVAYLAKGEGLEALVANVRIGLLDPKPAMPLWKRLLVFCLVAAAFGIGASFFLKNHVLEVLAAVVGALLFELLRWLLVGTRK